MSGLRIVFTCLDKWGRAWNDVETCRSYKLLYKIF